MARLTLCPHCETPASLPREFDESTRIECPACGKSFGAAEASATLASLMAETTESSQPATKSATSKTLNLDDLFGLGRQPESVEEPTSDNSATVEFPPDSISYTGGIPPAGNPTPTANKEIDEEIDEEIYDSDYDSEYDDQPFPAFEIDDAPENEPEGEYRPTMATTAAVTSRNRTKRRFSPVPTIIALLVGQVVAFVGGYCAVMWIQYARGDQRIDPWGLATYYPESVLPPGARDAPPAVARDDAHADVDANDDTEPPVESADDEPNRFELATFDGPVDPNEASEPATPAPMQPEPEATRLPTGQFALPGAPRYSTDELSQALTFAKEAMPTLLEGEFANPELRRAKGLSYATICRLAHVLTFYDTAAADYDMQTELEAQEQVFKRLLLEPKSRDDIATITRFWLASENRQAGVFFAGEVSSSKPAGPVFEYKVELPSGESITVVRRKHLEEHRFRSVDAVGFIGEVIDRPTERIVGYKSQEPWVVWAEHVLPIRTPAYAREQDAPAADPLGGFKLGPLPEIDL